MKANLLTGLACYLILLICEVPCRADQGSRAVNPAKRSSDQSVLAAPVSLQPIETAQGDYTLSISPASQNVEAGGTLTYYVTVNAFGGFREFVHMTASGLPHDTYIPFFSSPTNPIQFFVVTGCSSQPGIYIFTLNSTTGGYIHSASAELIITARQVKASTCLRIVRLEKRGKTTIEAGNHYSENTRLRATVVFPPGHPREGQQDKSFNGQITFSEEQGTTYYDGVDGATFLPQTVQVRSGRAEIEIKSVSNSPNITGPLDARIRAAGRDLTPQAATNPLSVDQWVDNNSNGFIDWLDRWTAAIKRCAQGQAEEVRTVVSHVSGISQSNSPYCGTTPILLAARSPILISPVCRLPDGQNLHRLNLGSQLSDSVLHEARHAWQNSERNRSVGTDDDRNPNTSRNDDDRDLFLERVSLSSAATYITEAARKSNDSTWDLGGIEAWEDEAANFAVIFKGLCQ